MSGVKDDKGGVEVDSDGFKVLKYSDLEPGMERLEKPHQAL